MEAEEGLVMGYAPWRPKKEPKVLVSYEKCVIITNLPMRCPLCGVDVKSMVKHECSRPKKKDG